MGNRKTHMLLHLGVKPYICGIEDCDRAFSQLGNLKSHQLKVHINPGRRSSVSKRSSSPSDTEDVPHHLLHLQARRHSDSTDSQPETAPRPTAQESAFADFDPAAALAASTLAALAAENIGGGGGGNSSRSRRRSSGSGHSKELRLLQKMKAVLERRSSLEEDAEAQ
ncbi:hypothetical protein HDU86_004378 [Geranomyces michiganensis]|nr:hypothetical protein HDU86_004378 [Geranomyces michiganensis]